MKETWKSELRLVKSVFWGDICTLSRERFIKYYLIDEQLKETINNLFSMLIDKEDYNPVMLVGFAGTGKTTLIHYYTTLYNDNNDIFVIDKEFDKNNSGTLKNLYDFLIQYIPKLLQLSRSYIDEKAISEMELKVKSVDEHIKKYDAEYKNDIEILLNINDDVVKVDELRFSDEYKNIVIFIDQVDLLPINTLEAQINDLLHLIKKHRYLQLVLSARKETLAITKKGVRNFWSTYFRRNIEISSPDDISLLFNRLENSSDEKKMLSKDELNVLLNPTISKTIKKISNQNIRKYLNMYQSLFSRFDPIVFKNNRIEMISFYLLETYMDPILDIDNILRIPLTKIVFDFIRLGVDPRSTILANIISKKVMKTLQLELTIALSDIEQSLQRLLDYAYIEEEYASYSMNVNILSVNSYRLTAKGNLLAVFLQHKNCDNYLKLYYSDEHIRYVSKFKNPFINRSDIPTTKIVTYTENDPVQKEREEREKEEMDKKAKDDTLKKLEKK